VHIGGAVSLPTAVEPLVASAVTTLLEFSHTATAVLFAPLAVESALQASSTVETAVAFMPLEEAFAVPPPIISIAKRSTARLGRCICVANVSGLDSCHCSRSATGSITFDVAAGRIGGSARDCGNGRGIRTRRFSLPSADGHNVEHRRSPCSGRGRAAASGRHAAICAAVFVGVRGGRSSVSR
jgi:hypothetical protein